MVKRNADSDATTVYAFRNGNTKALTYFFNCYYSPLVFFAGRLISDTTAAEDIVEESFIKLWERHQDFETAQNIKAFLYISTRNACMDYFRKNQRQTESHKDFSYTASSSEDPEDVFLNNETIRAEVLGEIYQEIERLPTKAREVFKLSYLKGLKNQEIADQMGISVNTVKNQKARAIQLLKVVLLKKDLWAILYMSFHYYCHSIKN
jgi:RNA polymerase sigma-70 factor (ECF subfamily)